jgi:hypothetical protein
MLLGIRGDSYDNAQIEMIIGLFKVKVIRRYGPCHIIDAIK